MYNHKEIEEKWQKSWEESELYQAQNDTGKPKKYILIEFPYPSGEGLHMGHLRPYVAGDVCARFFRMQGYEIMYPIGWDAFGLPAENFAIKKGVHPRVSTAKNIANAKRQLKSWGTAFDFHREINTTDPEYYKWTQWIFLQFFKAGLAYEATGLINWCPKDKTGLANEEVIDGKCERCGTTVEKKELRQWYLKITDYAEKLLDGLQTLDWPAKVKTQQANWIGRSEGASIKFLISNVESLKEVEVFTTRPDTIFGVTFLVISPELAQDWIIDGWQASEQVRNYIGSALSQEEQDRVAAGKEKTGVDTGIQAINPATQEKILVFVADYVLGGYGTGAIMAVPAHDERDFAFAKKYNLPIKEVVIPKVVDQKNPPLPGKQTVARRAIQSIIIDPKTGKILMLRWKKFPWTTFVTGGVEKDEDIITAARREILEESGYQNIKYVRTLGGPIESNFYAAHKGENRKALFSCLVFELENYDQAEISNQERGLHELVWLTWDEIANEKNLNCSEYEIWIDRLHNPDWVTTAVGVLINSGKFDGLDSEVASKAMALEFGQPKVQYKLRDWVFSRQRYWGEPIPLIHCDSCGVVPVPENQLPVTLPEIEKYEPTGTGQSPLAAIESWVNVKCPKCNQTAKRETNTMPQWAGSSWYWLRYADPHNLQTFAAKELQQYWTPVDIYFGGMEHTTLHLLYSRFWNLFLADQGLVTAREPFTLRVPHGIILAADGEKMSKSRGNVVNPDEIVNSHGADTLRMTEMFLGPHEMTVSWSDSGVLGIRRFLEKVVKISENLGNRQAIGLHKLIKKIGDDIQTYKFNTAIAAFMEFLNQNKQLTQVEFETFLILLAPFAPHLSEELWHNLDHDDSIHLQSWPQYDPAQIIDAQTTIAVQVLGKLRGTIVMPTGSTEADVVSQVKSDATIARYLSDKEIIKQVFVPDKLINFVVK